MERKDIGLESVHSQKRMPKDSLEVGGGIGEQGSSTTCCKGSLIKEAWSNLDMIPLNQKTVSEGISFRILKRVPRIWKENYVEDKYTEEMDRKWMEWKEKGVLERGNVELIMALGIVPKKGNKVRVVHNCVPINDCVPDVPFSLDGVLQVSKLLRKGHWMAKLDLKDGYEHVDISVDCRKYFGVCWRGETLRFAKLGFGFKLSPFFFQSLMEEVVKECNKRFGMVVSFVYLDDFLVFGRTEEECRLALDCLVSLLKELGLVINEAKSCMVPSQEMEYLGKVWNTLVGRVFNCENKVKEVVNMCDNLLRVGKCSIRHLESLVGNLEWL
ncbi:MAG: reverse transcriptase family protein, partial [Vulcanimicrobiaceae bacterium]